MPTDQGSIDADAERFIQEAAKAEGLTYHQWCKKYGIISPAQERRIRRHELRMGDDPVQPRLASCLKCLAGHPHKCEFKDG